VTETVRESGSSAFYLTKDTFDAVAISVAFVSEIEAVSATSIVQWGRAIDEKHRVVDVVFLTQLDQHGVVVGLHLDLLDAVDRAGLRHGRHLARSRAGHQ